MGSPPEPSGVRTMIQRRRLAGVAFGAAAVAVLAPSGASAHAMLHTSDPADGSRVPASPRTITLMFSEECRVTTLRLLNASGQEFQLRREASRNPTATATATVANPLAPGDYRLEWRAMGSDGHAMSGTVRFAVASR